MTGNDAAAIIALICLVLIFLVPIWAVLRLRVIGIIAGAVYTWLLGLLGRMVIDTFDAGLVIAFLFGWSTVSDIQQSFTRCFSHSMKYA